jgi:hypothetical protein
MLNRFGIRVEYAFEGVRAGTECRQCYPGLIVAINQCDYLAGRITLDAIARN